MNRLTITVLCLVCMAACAAGSSNAPVTAWESKESTATVAHSKPSEHSVTVKSDGIQTVASMPGDISQYPRKTGSPYVIKGITYYPLQNVEEGYQEIGIASWYGKDFHEKKTANGEIYNMHDMTAAHKTLPMPTFVKVENLENGRVAVVRVNDRGPFSKGRIIDLSYAAAQQLDLINTGTARVKLTVMSESRDHVRTEGKDIDLNRGLFAIQIGAFVDAENARKLAEEYRFGAVNSAQINGKTMYQVQIKGYHSKTAAQAALKEYENKFPGAFIISE